MTLQYAVIGIVSAVNVLIGGYAFFKNSSKPLNQVFFVFSFGMSLIGVGMILLLHTHHIIFDRLIFAGGYLMTLGLVLLSMKFPEDDPLPRGTWIAFLPLGALACLTPFGFLVKEVIFREDGILEPVNGPGIGAFVVVIGGYLFLSVWEFWKRYKSSSGVSKIQIQYLGLGAGVFAFSLFVFNVLLPAFGIFEFNIFGPISSIFFVSAVAYAIARYQLLDIRVVIQRGIVYLILLGLIVSAYLALVFSVGAWLHGTLSGEDGVFLAVGLLTVCIGIFTVPHLERVFRQMTDKFFFRDTYEYPRALQELSGILNRALQISVMRQKTIEALKNIFKTKQVEIVLFEDALRTPWHPILEEFLPPNNSAVILERQTSGSKTLQREYGIEVLAPISSEKGVIGIILLGSKKSGEAYRDEDAQLLTTFSFHASSAIEKAKLFEKVREYSETLEDRVKERTRDLENTQEEQRQMMIDISHRLQTPLAAVKSEIQFIKDERGAEEHLETFEKSIDGISKFIYDLLSLARLDMQREDIPKEKINLSELLDNLLEYFEVMASEQGIEISSKIEEDVFVMGSRNMLEELVMNLVSNSFKYLDPDRGGRVSIQLSHLGKEAILKISDNGRGISPEDLEKIFHRFYRGKTALDSGTGGTGLGLAISKRIAENHGGSINIQSNLGEGTEVSVTLGLCAN